MWDEGGRKKNNKKKKRRKKKKKAWPLYVTVHGLWTKWYRSCTNPSESGVSTCSCVSASSTSDLGEFSLFLFFLSISFFFFFYITCDYMRGVFYPHARTCVCEIHCDTLHSSNCLQESFELPSDLALPQNSAGVFLCVCFLEDNYFHTLDPNACARGMRCA